MGERPEGVQPSGGLVFRIASERYFLPAALVARVSALPQVVRLPGAPEGILGLGLSDGVILPLIEVGPGRGSMIVCTHAGEEVGLVGAEDIESGVFVGHSAGGVLRGGAVVPSFDLEGLYGRVHASTWRGSWGG